MVDGGRSGFLRGGGGGGIGGLSGFGRGLAGRLVRFTDSGDQYDRPRKGIEYKDRTYTSSNTFAVSNKCFGISGHNACFSFISS